MSLQLLEVRASVLMELIVDKLRLLDYEDKFCASREPPWPRLHKFYFSMACSDRHEQFHYFASLVSWLLGLIGRNFSLPIERQDPKVICADIMSHLRQLGFSPPTWQPSKLKQGYGDAVCSVLDSLTNLALEAQQFEFGRPIYNVQIEPDTCQSQPDNIVTEVSEEETRLPHDDSSGRELQIFASDGTCKIGQLGDLQLNTPMMATGKDWRYHLEQAQKLHADISRSLAKNNMKLERIEAGVTNSLEKLEHREKILNLQIQPLIADFSAVKECLTEAQQKHQMTVDNIVDIKQRIALTSEQLEKVKHTMVEESTKIADVSPLVQMKSSIHNLKVELKEIEVRIGVLQHTLFQKQLNETTSEK